MNDDPFVNEIRRLRDEHASRFHGDLRAMAEDTRRRVRESGILKKAKTTGGQPDHS